MNAIEEKSVSLWMDTATIPSSRPLQKDRSADVVIVGAGIVGLSTAYELANLGMGVIVLDRGRLVGGMTARTSAHLNSNIDDLYEELIRMRGEAEARAYLRMRVRAIDRIEEIQESEDIDCDFRRLDGYLFPAKPEDEAMLERELAACRQVGLRGVKFVQDIPIPDAGSGRSLLFPRMARFHPLKYAAGLIRAIEKFGGELFEETAVVEVKEQGDAVEVRTSQGNILRARAAVIATNSPIINRLAVHTKQAPYRSYVLAGRVPHGSVPDALYWDTLDPYHYVRLQPADESSDWLIVGGEDHKTGKNDDGERRVAKLEAWARSLVPQLGRIEYRWSGQVLDTVDYLPFTGMNPGSESIYIHTGDSGEGLSNGVIGSLVLRDLVRKRKNRNAAMLDPGRVTAKAALRFASENVTVAANLAEHVTGGEISSADELGPGEAALIREGGVKIAAYRDRKGKLHVRSASCTHSGCVLHWNSFEICWDCTCHGSHFSIDGEPLNAPAVTALAEASEETTRAGDVTADAAE